jgi:DNA-binding transcriptional LysR family regulator
MLPSKQLRILKAVATEENLTRAAEYYFLNLH